MTILQQYKQLLAEFVALPSVSTDNRFAGGITATVEWLRSLFEKQGLQVGILQGLRTNPVVVARYQMKAERTVLVYGHYDVQPAQHAQGWSGDPFQLREIGGRLLGRGVADNKGQLLIHMMSVFELIRTNDLDCNVTFLIEGNEEVSNPDLAGLLQANRQLLDCDELIISDGEIVGQQPTIEVSLRGGFNLLVRLRTAKADLHSGVAGGVVPNAAQELARLTSTLCDARGRVLVPGFYDGMRRPGRSALAQHAELVRTNPPQLGAQEMSANQVDFYTQTGLYPTLQITGISSGYTGDGFANIVPATSEVRLNGRTVVGQNSSDIAEAVVGHLLDKAPDYAGMEIDIQDVHAPASLNINTPSAKRAARLLETVYGRPPVLKHVGGAIPVVSDFQRILAVDPLLIPLAGDDCNMHGPDENLRLDLVEKGLEFSQRFFGGSSAKQAKRVK